MVIAFTTSTVVLETERLFRSTGEVGRWGERVAEVLEETIRVATPVRTGTLAASISGESAGNEQTGRSHEVQIDVAFSAHGVWSLIDTFGYFEPRGPKGQGRITIGATGGYTPITYTNAFRGYDGDDWLTAGVKAASTRFPSLAGYDSTVLDIGSGIDAARDIEPDDYLPE